MFKTLITSVAISTLLMASDCGGSSGNGGPAANTVPNKTYTSNVTPTSTGFATGTNVGGAINTSAVLTTGVNIDANNAPGATSTVTDANGNVLVSGPSGGGSIAGGGNSINVVTDPFGINGSYQYANTFDMTSGGSNYVGYAGVATDPQDMRNSASVTFNGDVFDAKETNPTLLAASNGTISVTLNPNASSVDLAITGGNVPSYVGPATSGYTLNTLSATGIPVNGTSFGSQNQPSAQSWTATRASPPLPPAQTSGNIGISGQFYGYDNSNGQDAPDEVMGGILVPQGPNAAAIFFAAD